VSCGPHAHPIGSGLPELERPYEGNAASRRLRLVIPCVSVMSSEITSWTGGSFAESLRATALLAMRNDNSKTECAGWL